MVWMCECEKRVASDGVPTCPGCGRKNPKQQPDTEKSMECDS